MKTNLAVLSLLTVGSFALAQVWEVDPAHTEARFKVKHMMVSNVTGTLSGIKGTVTVDDKEATKLQLNATMDPKTINTSNAKRDEHLKNADFFDVTKYPVMSFKSKKVTTGGNGKLEILGDLTMHGVTKEETIKDAEITGAVKDAWGNQRRGFSGNLTVARKDFGIIWNKTLDGGGIALGENVEVAIESELTMRK